MTIRNKTRGRYESQTAEAQARRNDKSTYEFEKCSVCGGTIVIWNGKRGNCAMCELKHDKEAEELDKEFAKALQIVLDNSFTPDEEPWDVIPDSSDTGQIVTVTNWQEDEERDADWQAQVSELRNGA